MSSATTGWIQDPNSRLDYTFNWNDWLEEGELIIGHNITVSPNNHPLALSVSASSSSSGKVTAWLDNGRKNTKYSVACEITTSSGRTETESIAIAVVEK